MKLQEVKNDIAKITYNPAENHLLPADFVLIEDTKQKLIAQIMEIETDENSTDNIAVLRLSLVIDKEDNLLYYNGYIPSKSSKILYINPDEIMELVRSSGENLFLGALSNHSDCFVKPAFSLLDDKLYIQSDREDKTRTIIQNIISQIQSKNKKAILIDFDGSYSSGFDIPSLVITKDFKLPLSIGAFDTILEKDTNTCPLEDKAVIESIVLELREYLSTLENNFLPFTVFKNVVDNEFMASPISGLMLLRNKLWLYAQEGLFAESKAQFDVINSALLKNNAIIIDASRVEEKWYRFIIQTVIELTGRQSYILFSLNDVETDKKSIINLYNSKMVTPIVFSGYDSRYRKILLALCKNYIMFKPANILEEAPYSIFLNKMNAGEFIVYGEATLYLPLLLDCHSFTDKTSDEIIENEIKKDVDKLFSISPSIIPKQSEVKNETEKINIIQDNELTESDFDFLDELESENAVETEIPDNDISSNVGVNSETNDNYDVFSPVLEEDAGIIIEEVSIPVNNIQIENQVSETNINSEELVKEIILETQTDYIGQITENDLPVLNRNEDTEDNILQLDSDINIDITKEENTFEDKPLSETADDEENTAEDKPVSDTADDEEENTVEDKPVSDTAADEEENTIEDKPLSDTADEEENTIEDKPLSDTADEEENAVEDKPLSDTADEEENAVEDKPLSDTADECGTDELISDEDSSGYEDKPTVIDDLVSAIEKKASNSQNKVSEEPSQREIPTLEEQPQVQPPPLKKNIAVHSVPQPTVYETDISAKVSISDLPFKIGDRVYHPKHGTGVVEGFANYSNKILFCQIEFENIGRRILDPRVSGLEKIS